MSYQIGTSAGTKATLATLSVVDPKSSYKPGAQRVRLTSGGSRDIGYPQAVWRWGFITQAQRNALRAYCTGASATVYITTRVNDTISTAADAYDDFQAIMHWPEEEDREAFRRIGFELTFTNLVPT
jgi:hypothetical protein